MNKESQEVMNKRYDQEDLPKKNAKIPMTSGMEKVISHFISQKEADISLLPTISVPLVSYEEETYKVRTLLDSGSMTNWIARGVLNNVNNTVKGHTTLEVVTLTGSVNKRFKLVEVLYRTQNQKQNINCYVLDEFTQHVTVKGIVEHIIRPCAVPESRVRELADPNTRDIDHAGLSQGL